MLECLCEQRLTRIILENSIGQSFNPPVKADAPTPNALLQFGMCLLIEQMEEHCLGQSYLRLKVKTCLSPSYATVNL